MKQKLSPGIDRDPTTDKKFELYPTLGQESPNEKNDYKSIYYKKKYKKIYKSIYYKKKYKKKFEVPVPYQSHNLAP
jgi:hypothetical protein